MTRTSKALFPRALAQDRHTARNGRGKDMKKDGYKAWGSLDGSVKHAHHLNDQDRSLPPVIVDGDDDDDGFEDVDEEEEDEEERQDRREDEKVDQVWLKMLDMTLLLHARGVDEEERREALNVRKDFGKQKKGAAPVTLADIARSSAVVSTISSSSPSTSPETPSSLSASYFSHSDSSSFSGRK
ncbi:hypothetical protein BDY24DRAFT_390563 [Mrakia frigida]|uniref:uncharacterized protein n=1 Tax=Mrakia frigida TaxID=29902 RepID=UPI003FCC0297